MLHRLCGPPSIPLSFIVADVLPRWYAYCVNCVTGPKGPTTSIHRLQRGLPGYLILFAPHALVPQRQYRTSWPPSPLVFFVISMHFTATPRIPPTSSGLKKPSIEGHSAVERQDFTPDLGFRLRTLYTQ